MLIRRMDCVLCGKHEKKSMDNICIGTAQFGMEYGIANEKGRPGLNEVRRIVESASQRGIYFYDTAVSYGTSETVLGSVFSDLSITDKAQCITKLPPDFNFRTYTDLKRTVEQSLERLGMSSLWGLLIHRSKVKGNWSDFINAVRSLKEERIIKNFGVSVYRPEDASRFAGDEDMDIIQVPFNILDKRLFDNGFFDIAQKARKIVFIRSVFLQGLFLMNRGQLADKRMEWSIPYLLYLWEYVKKNAIDSKSFALKMVRQCLPHANLIVGIESRDQLIEDIGVLETQPLPEELVQDWWKHLPEFPEKLLNPSLWCEYA